MYKKILLLTPLFLMGCGDQHQKDHMEAMSSYNELKASTNPSAMFRLAESMKKNGNLEIAAKSYKQSLEVDPVNYPAYLGLSQCLRMMGKPAAALQTLNKVPSEARDIAWYKELGGVYTISQKPRQCIEAYNRAHEQDSSDIGALNGLAVCNDLMGKHTEAQRWYQQAIAITPLDTNLRSNLGLSMALSGRPEEAIEILQEVLSTETATPRDRQNLAIAYGLAGNMDTAAKLFAQDLSEKEVRINLAFLHKLSKTQPKPQQHAHTTDETTAASPTQPTQETAPSLLTNPFTTDLAAPANPEAQPINHSLEASPPQVLDTIAKDSHVAVSPLPTVENYHQEALVIEPAKEEIKAPEDVVKKEEDKSVTPKNMKKKPAPAKEVNKKEPVKKKALKKVESKKAEPKKANAKKADKKIS